MMAFDENCATRNLSKISYSSLPFTKEGETIHRLYDTSFSGKLPNATAVVVVVVHLRPDFFVFLLGSSAFVALP